MVKKALAILFFLCFGQILLFAQSATFSVANANCISPTGTISLNTVTGPAPVFTIMEGAAPIGTTSTLPYLFSASVGSHTYDVLGSNSVTVTFTAAVGANTIAPNIFATGGGTVTCSNLNTQISATSNVSSATYTWMPQNLNTNTVLAFSGGNFTVGITDPSNGCTKDTVVFVYSNTTAPSISATANGSITCTNTVVVLTGTSTTSGVTYSWSNGATTNTVSVTSVGIYTLTVTDPANGCRATKAVTVYPITAFAASVSIIDHVKCNGASTASVQVDVIGGSGIFSISVVNTNSTAGIFTSMPDTVVGLSAGSVTLFILDTLSGCTQVKTFTITQPPALNLSLILLSVPEICAGEPVTITSQMSGGVRPYQYNWLFGLGADSTLSGPGFQSSYTLQAQDVNLCLITAVKTLTVNPKPSITFVNSPITVCGPSLCVNFTLAAAQNTTFVYNWEFTDANGVATPIQVNQYNPSICFSRPGLYNVDLNVISVKGCATQSYLPTYIKLYPVVKANYSFDQIDGAYIFNDVLFNNQSAGAYWFNWYNENDLFSTDANPNYIFQEPGQHLVSLIASNPACSDTISKYVIVNEATFVHIPNAFTPNGDKLNDVWQPKFYGDFQSGQYELSVFDRWGNKVFWTVTIDNAWDGSFKHKPCEEGVYTYEIKLNTNAIANKEYRGKLILYR